MSLNTELKDLADFATDVAKISDPKLRHEGGWVLNGKLDRCYQDHLFSDEQHVEFMAIIKIMLDVIFADAVENNEPEVEWDDSWD